MAHCATPARAYTQTNGWAPHAITSWDGRVRPSAMALIMLPLGRYSPPPSSPRLCGPSSNCCPKPAITARHRHATDALPSSPLGALPPKMLAMPLVLGRMRWPSSSVFLRPSTSLLRRNALRSEEHTSELQSRGHLVCRLLLEKKNA